MPKIAANLAFLFLIPVLVFASLAVLFVTLKRNAAETIACTGSNLSGEFLSDEKFAYFEGQQIPVPEETRTFLANVLGSEDGSEKWIEIDLKKQKLIAWEKDRIYLETPVSTGLPWTPTPTGEFRIWSKLRYTKMEGGEGKYYYNLPNVPFVMFFANDKVAPMKGYGLHGTYWHNDFGTPRSHGCVNLPTPIAEKLFYWTRPVVPEGKSIVRADNDNSGTKIVIHN